MSSARDVILERLKAVKGRIEEAAGRAGRDPSGVELVAVTKSATAEAAAALVREGGVRHLGENRVADAAAKAGALKALGLAPVWRMVGHLQTNKAGLALKTFDALDSLDSARLAEALEKRLSERGTVLPALVQVNLTGNPAQSGLAPESVEEFLERCRRFVRLDVRGLMAIAPMTEPVEGVRPHFRRMRALFERLFPGGAARPGTRGAAGTRSAVLSMGMSRDFEIAVEEGSTMVRIGSALFA